jgi:glucan-binding YG repeat protein
MSRWYAAMAVPLTIGLLSACTQSQMAQDKTSGQTQQAQQNDPQKPAVGIGDGKAAGQAQTPEPKTPAAEPKTTGHEMNQKGTTVKSLPKNKTIEVTLEGMKEKKKGTLFKSEQKYYLYTLPGFTATGEEPGKDMILVDRDDRHFMRIERFPSDVNIADAINNAREELKLTGEVNEHKGDLADPFFNQAKAYLFASDGKVTRAIIIQEIKGQKFRFTLNIAGTESSEGMIPSFWAMIKTIGILK